MTNINVDTSNQDSIVQLVKAMVNEEQTNIMTVNMKDEVVKIELYREHESVVEPKEHLRYVIYHDDDKFQTEMYFDYEGNKLHEEVVSIAPVE